LEGYRRTALPIPGQVNAEYQSEGILDKGITEYWRGGQKVRRTKERWLAEYWTEG
jgi:hypothetical protein